ncbi:unnamed protein product [Sphenostylis stenocarpa]|uniref:Uncharacterized protein n=1 Tax=Sphenostylis stenocarpa TaxID=92480 RepID=A0AA86RX99_9FABA|nr:unnamed protein product [Sphenostylis stenocarpa]
MSLGSMLCFGVPRRGKKKVNLLQLPYYPSGDPCLSVHFLCTPKVRLTISRSRITVAGAAFIVVGFRGQSMLHAASAPGHCLSYPRDIRYPRYLKTPSIKTSFSVRCSVSQTRNGAKVEYTPWLIVGLGNPGNKYHGTRHNVGFEIIDSISRAEGIKMNTIQSKALIGIGSIGEVPILLAKPQTYMNFSGESVGPLAAYYQVPLRHILLVYDETSLPNGVLRLQPKGGHGHHNGLKNVMGHLDGCSAFPRLAVGIGNPPGTMDLRAFLLQKFSSVERMQIDASLEQGVVATVANSNILLNKALKSSDKNNKKQMTLSTKEHHNMATAEHSNVSLQQHTSPTVDTISLISLTSAQMQGFLMMELERGPRYQAYAELRERKLRMKYMRQQEYEEKEEGVEVEAEAKVLTPPRKKQVKFQGVVSGRKGSSLVAQSVPDFSAALRKENRKPVNSNMLPPLTELTPPSKRMCGVLSSARGSKSANAGEKRRGGGGVLMPRKSYASIDELKSLSSATANAINGESRGGGRSSRVMTRKSVLGYKQHI